MSNFICIHCGTTMSSKCPGQRSVFMETEVSSLASALAFHDVRIAKDQHEIFFNLTVWRDEDILGYMQDFITRAAPLLKKATCNHYWVRNSTTERDCEMGCKHSNLSDKKRLLKKFAAEQVKRNEAHSADLVGGVKQNYRRLLRYTLDRMATDLRRAAYPDGDRQARINRQTDELHAAFTEMYNRLGSNEPVRGMYRIGFGYRSELKDEYFQNSVTAYSAYEDLKRLGVECALSMYSHDTGRYEPPELEPRLLQRCGICDEFIQPGDKAVALEAFECDVDGREKKVRELGRFGHEKCYKPIQERHKIITRVVTIVLNSEEEYQLNRSDRNLESIAQRELRRRGWDWRFVEVLEFNPGRFLGTARVKLKALGHIIQEAKVEFEKAKPALLAAEKKTREECRKAYLEDKQKQK